MKRIPSLPHITVLGLTALAAATGLLSPLTNALTDARFAVDPRSASGEVVLVAIDAKSLSATGNWPWPRQIYAKAIDRLSAAGVSEIALDIDFSATSTPEADDAFELALKSAGGSIILPTFKQFRTSAATSDLLHVNRPLERFGRHSWPATVNVRPEPNGQIRSSSYGETVGSEFVPSIAALFGGEIDRAAPRFLIDFAIRPQTIPTYSFSDVLDGTVPAAAIAGKKILIGGTAAELGDRFVVPVHGIISGPRLQILAAESIAQGRTLHMTGLPVALTGIAMLGVVAWWAWRRRALRWQIGILLAAIVPVEGLALTVQHFLPVIVDTAPVHAVIFGYLCFTLFREIDLRRLLALIARTDRENTRRILTQVISDSFGGVVITDETGKILAASSATNTILGLDPHAAITGRHMSKVLPESLVVAGETVLAVNGDAVAIHQGGEVTIHRQPEAEAVIEYLVTPSRLEGRMRTDGTRDPGMQVVTFTFRDVTAERAAERAIRDAADAAIASNAAKTTFLANMSHELRTPLNAILGFSDIIRNQTIGPIGKDDYAEFASEIHSSGSKLLEVLNDILDVTRAETGDLALHDDEIEVDDLIESAVQAAASPQELRDRNVATTVAHDLPWLRGDYRRIKRALTNIIGNAVKFTEPGGHVAINGFLDNSGELVITVSDDGIGIPADAIEKVTQAFFQADAALSRKHDGSGLGLTLAAASLKAHGARLELSSEPGRGTLARVVFPVDRMVRQAGATETAPRLAAAGGGR